MQESDERVPRTRLQIVKDELIEAQELITALFIERDIAIELQDMIEAEKQHSHINALGRRRKALERILEIAQNAEDKIAYSEFPATIFIKNYYFQEVNDG